MLNVKCSERFLAVIFKVTHLMELSPGQKVTGKLETQILGRRTEYLLWSWSHLHGNRSCTWWINHASKVSWTVRAGLSLSDPRAVSPIVGLSPTRDVSYCKEAGVRFSATPSSVVVEWTVSAALGRLHFRYITWRIPKAQTPSLQICLRGEGTSDHLHPSGVRVKGLKMHRCASQLQRWGFRR